MAQNKEYTAFKKAIAENKLGNLYIIHGAENYLKEHYLGQMKKSVLGDGPEGFNLKKIEGKSLDISELYEAVEALPSFSQRTFVEVHDFDIYKAPEHVTSALIELFKDVPDYCCLVFMYDTVQFKANRRKKKLHSVIEEKAVVVEIATQEHSNLISWISRHFKAHGKSISRENAEYLIHYCGDLMTGLNSEIEKIAAYSTGKSVTKAEINAVAIPVIDTIAFNLTNAISKNDYDKAAEIMAELFQLRESPVFLLSLIGGQIRRLYAARLVHENGKNAKFLKSMLGLRTDYQANLLMQSARTVSLEWCSNAVCLCADTDLKMKSTPIGDEELLISLLIKLAA